MEQSISDYFMNATMDIAKGLQNPQEYSTKFSMMLFIIIIGFTVEFLGMKLLKKKIKNVKTLYRCRAILKSTTRTIMILATLKTWMQAMDTFILLLFLAALFVSIYIKGMINNIIAWFIIEKRKHFRLYDRIEIDGVKGEVIKTGFIHFTIVEISNWFSSDAPTGRTIKIPNSYIFDNEVFNYTELNHFVWNEICYTISHDSNWKKGQDILTTVCEKEYNALKNRTFKDVSNIQKELAAIALSNGSADPTFNMDVTTVGIDLKVRYLVHYREGSSTKTRLHQQIMTELAKQPDIQFANFLVEMSPGLIQK